MRRIFILAALVVALAAKGQTTVELKKAGELAEVLTQQQRDTCTHLKVKGKLNSADIRVLRQMAGYRDGDERAGVLKTLDLADAEFVTDKTPYMVLDAAKEQLAATALVAGEKTSKYMMGQSLASDHNTNQNKYWHEGWEDHRNEKWTGNFYVDRTELMAVKHKSTTFRPKYFLGRKGEADIHLVSGYSYTERGNTGNSSGHVMTGNSGQFFFGRDTFTDADWKLMNDFKITSFKGHRLVQEDGSYLLKVYCQKGLLPHDMFYGCESLQHVVMPVGLFADKTVLDESSTVKYTIPYDRATIFYIANKVRNRPYRPYYMGRYGIEKRKALAGEEATRLSALLESLPSTDKGENYEMDVSAFIMISYADGRKAGRFYLDADGTCVQSTYTDPKYYVPSKELLDILHSKGVRTRFLKTYKSR